MDMNKKGNTKKMFIFVLVSALFFVVFASVNEARPDYGLGYDTFRALPSMPDDFDAVMEAINRTLDYDVGEEYYKQPEFYPTFEKFIGTMKNPPGDRIAIWGVGLYPARHEYRAYQGNDFTVVVYLHAAWMVQTFQGAMIDADYNKEYFDVSVSPDTVLLGPAYPGFDKDWAQKIAVKIRVKNAPKGVHYVTVNPGPPPPEQIEEWRNIYKGLYVSMSSSSPDQPYLKIAVDVQ